jgi:hypothetical protein
LQSVSLSTKGYTNEENNCNTQGYVKNACIKA